MHSDFSPDGRWLAYASDESGRSEVYLRAVRGEGRSLQVSTEGGREPAWSPKGGRLYFRQGSAMMAVAVAGRDALTIGRPQRLFDGGWELLESIWHNAGTTFEQVSGSRFGEHDTPAF